MVILLSKVKGHLKDKGIDVKMPLEWASMMQNRLIWHRIGFHD
jgi:hypothetical protein